MKMILNWIINLFTKKEVEGIGFSEEFIMEEQEHDSSKTQQQE